MINWPPVQLRNTATIGGNIVTASPISDINALLMAAGASYTVAAADQAARSLHPQHFITGHRWASRGSCEPSPNVTCFMVCCMESSGRYHPDTCLRLGFHACLMEAPALLRTWAGPGSS